ncbi:asparagine synthase (glutamine-hydrolyzing) [Acidihalobacter ferrooxydans]|uniref:asparagine synthase (glutamine-hydrolyzing) n=1 Tax=Acidihalobacter ferrooxydans TaxID=1765967 RepID=A0A1P8UJ18_9GAMM|nr:asparagine synthase (glutamine-hydrolyzing) [Acidihalobacter ferrooxydans]APZ43813.1 asparagine synthase (glutamine-hydrolyzing) [Acidihalobacter ferrooxydans]
MCGILGAIGTRWLDAIPGVLNTLTPRGPDGYGIVHSDAAILAHRRLAIIDLAGGTQPMQSEDRRWNLSFNGEIYNYRELRAELEATGWTFRSHSDTEVLLQGWRAWGEALLDRLDGIYAFALWDVSARRLILARDRIGIKPLFYALQDKGLVFASTLSPFFALPGFPQRLDPEALRDYLACQAVQAPRSILRDVRQLPPASVLTFEQDTARATTRRFWQPSAPHDTAPFFEDALTEVDAAVRESVRRQMVADVPLGAFLSGGIDSSLMIHYMAEAGVKPLKTFNIRFPQVGFDETPAAQAVAARYATDHTVIDAPAIDGAAFEAAIAALDQPLADPAYVTTHELSRLTRQTVTVAISGDGGDELFAGYPRFAQTEGHFPDSLKRRLVRAGTRSGWLPGRLTRHGLAGREMLLYRHVELGPFPHSRKDMSRYLEPATLSAAHPNDTLELWRDLALGYGAGMDTESLMRADLWTYLSEDCLVKTDRASMDNSLEVRVPLLGNPVLDLVLDWPARIHFDADGGKALLRALARSHLPENVWNRPKHGFSVPLQHYFNGQWSTVCEEHLARCEEIAPFLNAPAVRTLWHSAKRGKASRRLAYTFVVLLIWLARHPISS